MSVRRASLLVMVMAMSVAVAGASTRYDPRLRFRTISTSRFHIHYHQGGEGPARRLAVVAERVAGRLEATLGLPSGRVHVVLVDQDDLANGWATPVPYNLIEIRMAVPDPASVIGNTDDWLELVFTHEYTHVVHLSRSAGWIGGLRRGFGRMPLLFPNLYLPLWQIEGLATYEESAVTGEGRVPAGDFRRLLTQAAGVSRFEPLDRANGGLVDWPAGTTPYLYGAYFHDYLAKRFGAASLRRLADETARRIPYLGASAFERVFGQPLGDLWRDFEEETQRDAGDVAALPQRLTAHGFTVTAPRFAPDGRLFYSIVNPHAFPAMLAREPDGSHTVEVTSRYLGNGLGFAGSVAVFDQSEVVNQVGLQSDLYAVSTQGGRSWRVTRHARAADPDVAPDGMTIVCTVQRPDRRDLSIVRLPAARGETAEPTVILSAPDTHFASPRWSPDGRWIAVERTRPGAASEIVLVDPAAKAVIRTLSPATAGRSVTPAWSPDGRVLFASDWRGQGFQILSVAIDGRDVRRLTGTGTTALSPTVSPDGRVLVFVGYTADGYDLFSIAPDDGRWEPVADGEPGARPPAASALEQAANPEPRDRGYAPWRSLAPRFWTPTLESDADEIVAGAATGSADALGRHVYAAEIGWTTARGRPDWQVAYAYDRWWPTLFANVADDTDPFRSGQARTTEVNAGALLPIRRVRWSQSALAAFHAATDVIDCATCAPAIDQRVDRRAVRAGWSVNAARGYGYSISTEEGWRATVSTELTRRALGSDEDTGSTSLDMRGYVPVWPRHGVLAVRIAGAASWGEERTRRRFSAGGSSPQSGGFRFGFDAIGLVRGVDEDDLAGTRAAVLNVDYRLPLARVERGAGTWPLFVRAIHGAVFADAGSAWMGRFHSDAVRVSVGAELSMDAVVGFVLPVTFTTGAAWRESPEGTRSVVAFGRIGRAF
jgi:dipeptidyl aminopeptidase/acylaminoacyl peptidase